MPKKFVRRKKYSKAKPRSAIDKKQEKDIRYLKHMVKLPEMKVQFNGKNTPLEMTSDTNAMIQFKLTPMAQGITSGTRIGDAVNVHQIRFKGIANYKDALGGVSNFLRFMIVRIKGLYRTLTPSQVLQFYQIASTQRFDNMISPYNTDYVRAPNINYDSKDNDTVILWDKVIPFDPVNTVTSGSTTTKFKYFTHTKIFKRPIPVTWADNGNDGMGHLVLLVLPGCSVSASNNPAYTWDCNVYFTDS